MGALGTAAVLAVAVYAWPAPDPADRGPRPAGEARLPAGSVDVAVGGVPDEVAVGRGVVWVADTAGDTVVRIDPATNRAVATVELGGTPGDLAVAQDGALWVAIPELGMVQRIDPVTNAPAPDVRADVAAPGTPLDLAVDDHLWVAAVGEALVRVDLSDGRVLGRSDELRPVNVAARDSGVFVLEEDGVARAVDPATGEPNDVRIGFDVSRRGDLHLHAGRLWVAQGDGSELFSVAAASGSERATRHAFRGEYVEMVLGRGRVLVLSDLGDGIGLVSSIDRDSGEVTEVAEVPGGPRDLVGGLDDLWVTRSAAGIVTRIDDLP